MKLENLPMIREKDIDRETKIVDIAEICYDWLPFPNENIIYFTDLCYVLGISNQDVFVANRKAFYPNTGKEIIGMVYGSDTYKRINHKSIKSYTSLLNNPKKTK